LLTNGGIYLRVALSDRKGQDSLTGPSVVFLTDFGAVKVRPHAAHLNHWRSLPLSRHGGFVLRPDGRVRQQPA